MTRPAALVTGAGGRLGRAMAVRLAEMGHDVAVHYASSAAGAAETVALVETAGGRGVAIQTDLLDMDQTDLLIGKARDALDAPLSVLINSASVFEHDTIETATRAAWDRHMGSNLQAPFFLTQAFAEQAPRAVMDARGEPVAQSNVINMIDQRVRKLTPEFMTYTIAKMGLWAFTQTAARGLTPHIRVNGIGPGPTMRGGRQTEEHFEAQRKATISGRGSNPEDIVGAMQYILNAPALTGQLLCIDGGQHLGWLTPDIQGVE
ncbi:SDR family oxidoreductase [Litoreibacter sp.]|nr:SDR family oxidoreductase [Litoreibacter sp.]